MRTTPCISASETGFCNGMPVISNDSLVDGLEAEIKMSLVGHQASALQAIKDILQANGCENE